MSDTAAYLSFYYTVINKNYEYNIELQRRQYSCNKHKAIREYWNSELYIF
ncbi:MAG: hypothetical protein O4861_05295 [Trichodesmium sp. St16_bin4-tuft]|nr:hypothetical protein [Trichodesmium sp. MAG_R01]MDE5074453.1 hypothetical protein [Trichodesmium sp. St5_bin8]MDE5079316.1 hypothetical protein [Trichodesmium sp. St2_bin6]MDE5097781.1 hypothetical protein [Trichodesmium sp. St16_bin4-tuft]MDE5105149.1 hypothetical protein [Trichodesmium sp. St19_bin2]